MVRKYNYVAIFVLVALVLMFIVFNRMTIENFFGATQPGTMVQLASSHIPTEEELKKEIKQINTDIQFMTEGPSYPGGYAFS